MSNYFKWANPSLPCEILLYINLNQWHYRLLQNFNPATNNKDVISFHLYFRHYCQGPWNDLIQSLRQFALIHINKKRQNFHSAFDLYLVSFRFSTATALVACQLLFCSCRWIDNISCFVNCFMMNCTSLNFYWFLCCTTTFTI